MRRDLVTQLRLALGQEVVLRDGKWRERGVVDDVDYKRVTIKRDDVTISIPLDDRIKVRVVA